MKNKKGFTLIELLVVIAIIGLLSTLAVVSLNNARSKARDARRTSDLKAMQSAVELYKVDTNDQIFALPATWLALGTTLTNYLPAGAPTDPLGTNKYNLCVNEANEHYVIAATLENAPASGSGGIASTGWVVTDCRNESAAQAVPTCTAGSVNYCLGNTAK